jgi:cytochrome c biogenesis protein CcmG, thiol:disulfide interchange protein DsbE
MHKIKTAFLAIMLSLIAFQTQALTVGEAGPAFDLPGDGASTVKLSSYKGKVIYVDFWASWCGPCKQSFPWLNDMQSKYGSKGFQVLALNVDVNTTDAKNFLNTNPAKFTIAYDAKGVTPKAYGIKGMPSSVLLDADGKVLFQHTGFRESDRAQLEKTIQQALGQPK